MSELYKRGDRVKHAVKTEWGLGEVLDDQVGDKVRIIFEDVGVKPFALQYTPLVRVAGDEAQSSYLDALVKYHGKKAGKTSGAAAQFISFSQALRSFLGIFPCGFNDPNYLSGRSSERDYKQTAHEYVRDQLSRDQMMTLIGSGRYSEICDRAKKAINQTNLIHHYEKIWLGKGISSEGRQALFARELANLLYGDKPIRERFESFVKMLYDIGAAKWTIATYFLFLAFPDSQIFVKPEVTKHAARVLGIDIVYEPEVNWPTYDHVLHLAAILKEKLAAEGRDDLVPKDMIDVQSFIWVIGPGYFV
jgi:hypothetical protein